eukprot:5630868-Lingulodinium_polyedra.AAC.1
MHGRAPNIKSYRGLAQGVQGAQGAAAIDLQRTSARWFIQSLVCNVRLRVGPSPPLICDARPPLFARALNTDMGATLGRGWIGSTPRATQLIGSG